MGSSLERGQSFSSLLLVFEIEGGAAVGPDNLGKSGEVAHHAAAKEDEIIDDEQGEKDEQAHGAREHGQSNQLCPDGAVSEGEHRLLPAAPYDLTTFASL